MRYRGVKMGRKIHPFDFSTRHGDRKRENPSPRMSILPFSKERSWRGKAGRKVLECYNSDVKLLELLCSLLNQWVVLQKEDQRTWISTPINVSHDTLHVRACKGESDGAARSKALECSYWGKMAFIQISLEARICCGVLKVYRQFAHLERLDRIKNHCKGRHLHPLQWLHKDQ